MSNNKQSSVDWLIEQLTINPISDITDEQWFGIMGQAKAMHKKEVTTFTADWSIQWKYDNGKSINEYYNKTFGGNNE